MKSFAYHEPESLAETFALLQLHGEDAVLLAGGTALLVDMKQGHEAPGHLVSLWGVPALANVHQNGGLRVGTLTTATALARALGQAPAYSALAEAARLLGGRQIQNMATVGGNICYASPGADLVPPLLVLDAVLQVHGPDGQRETALDGFLTAPATVDLRAQEVLTRIDVPTPPPRTGTAFIKIMRRQALDCSIVSVAARVTLAEDGERCDTVRIGLGAVAPTPIRAKRAEALLAGEKVTPDRLQAVATQAREETTPISDVRASADYRRTLTEMLVPRAIRIALARAQRERDA